jgi:hypothetical protein
MRVARPSLLIRPGPTLVRFAALRRHPLAALRPYRFGRARLSEAGLSPQARVGTAFWSFSTRRRRLALRFSVVRVPSRRARVGQRTDRTAGPDTVPTVFQRQVVRAPLVRLPTPAALAGCASHARGATSFHVAEATGHCQAGTTRAVPGDSDAHRGGRPFRPVPPCWPVARVSSALFAGPFLCDTSSRCRTFGGLGRVSCASWPDDRPSGGALGIAALRSFDPARKSSGVSATVNPHAVSLDGRSAFFAEDKRPEYVKGRGAPVRGHSSRLPGFPAGKPCAFGTLLPWAFPLPGLQTPRLRSPLRRAGRVSSPRPAIDRGFPLPVPSAPELGRRV